MPRVKKYKIEKSKYPTEEEKYILVLESESQHGINYQRVFKGNYKDCVEKKRCLESV